MHKGHTFNFLRSLVTDWRYWVALVILGLAFTYGKNIGTPAQPSDIVVESPFYGGKYTIGASQIQTIVPKVLDSRAGDYYRLSFKGQNYRPQLIGVKDDAPMVSPKEGVVMVQLLSPEGTRKTLKKVTLPFNTYGMQEIIFKTDGIYRDIQFIRDGNNYSTNIAIDSVHITRLAINDAEASTLKPSVFGLTAIDRIKASAPVDNPEIIFDFSKRNQIAGQIFKAKGGPVSSVALQMLFKGNGGIGSYTLELRPAAAEGDHWVISQKVLATFLFDKYSASHYYQYPGMVNGYRFPLAADLDKDSYYFVGVTNSVNFNSANHLQFLGTTSREYYQEGAGVVGGKNGVATSFGTIGFATFAADFNQVGSVRIPDGVRIEDIGGGEGLYHYDKGTSYLNKLDEGIGTDERELVYQFDALYPIKQFALNLQLGANYPTDRVGAGVYYSLDNEHWEAISANIAFGELSSYSVSGIDGKQKKTFYLKIIKDTPSTDVVVKDLSADARLIIR